MDTVLQALLSWQFVLFALAIAALTFVIRKVVEFALDNPSIPTGKMTKTDRLWTELLLPILPVVLGAVAGLLAKKYPFPDGLTNPSARIAFGLVAGLLSGLVYRVIKGTLAGKIAAVVNAAAGGAPLPPPAPPAAGTPDAPEDPGASVRNTINNG
jgi:hypothetical protein